MNLTNLKVKKMDLKNEEEINALKTWLDGMLKIEKVTVTFTKQDGNERVMKCTTNPIYFNNAKDELTNRNEDVCTVFDLEVNEWRSFRYVSIKRVEFSLGD